MNCKLKVIEYHALTDFWLNMHPKNSLSNKQIKFLRGVAHHIRPVVMVGQNGLSDNVKAEIRLALEQHELVKIKLAGFDATQRKQAVVDISESQHAQCVQAIGGIAVFFKHNPEKPKIELPNT